MTEMIFRRINLKKFSISAPQLFKWFFCIQFLVWTVIPCVSRFSLHHDVLEGITQGLQFEWGYSKHPFLSMWLLASIWKLSLESNWVIYVFSQAIIGVGLYYSWLLNQRLLPQWYALIATLLLSTVFFYTTEANILTPDSFQIPIWSAILYFYDLVVIEQKLKDWLWLGFWVGLGVIVKYQVVILMLGLFIYTLIRSERRFLIYQPGMVLALFVVIILVAPNGYWLFHHWDLFIHYMDSEVHNYDHLSLVNLIFKYLNNICGILSIPALILVLAFPKRQKIDLDKSRSVDIYAYALGSFVVTLVILCFSRSPVFGRWLTPYFSAVGALLVYLWCPKLSARGLKRFLSLIGLLTIISAIWVSVPTLNKNPKCDAYYPNQNISDFLIRVWQAEVPRPLRYLAGSRYLVASALPYMRPHPTPFFSLDFNTNPWIVEADLLKSGAVFVWDIENNYTWDVESMRFNTPPYDLLHRFPQMGPIEFKTFYTARGRAIKIAYSILRPQ